MILGTRPLTTRGRVRRIYGSPPVGRTPAPPNPNRLARPTTVRGIRQGTVRGPSLNVNRYVNLQAQPGHVRTVRPRRGGQRRRSVARSYHR